MAVNEKYIVLVAKTNLLFHREEISDERDHLFQPKKSLIQPLILMTSILKLILL